MTLLGRLSVLQRMSLALSLFGVVFFGGWTIFFFIMLAQGALGGIFPWWYTLVGCLYAAIFVPVQIAVVAELVRKQNRN